MERPLYSPIRQTMLTGTPVTAGDEQLDHSALFGQIYVDPAPLSAGVRRALAQRSHVGLRTLVHDRPLRHGLAELVTYLSLRDETFEVVFDERVSEQIAWSDPAGVQRVATLPRVTFAKTVRLEGHS